MLTVSHEVVSVELDLVGGLLACPGCRGRLRPWGWARERLIRHGVGSDLALVRGRPRRGRCADCLATHVLLGVDLAARRADTAAVIAAAVEAKVASGAGHRPIAGWLGRPVSTVRGWLRAFMVSSTGIMEAFTALVHRDGADAAGLWPAPATGPAGGALAAVAAYAGVLAARFSVGTVAWQSAGLAVAGPFFFSASRWQDRVQHELALMPGMAGGKGGRSAG